MRWSGQVPWSIIISKEKIVASFHHNTSCTENELNLSREGFIYDFKNKATFIKLEIESECSYYLEARKKNRDFLSNLIT